MRTLTEADIAPVWNRIRAEQDHNFPLATNSDPFRRTVMMFSRELVALFGGGISEVEARERERKAGLYMIEHIWMHSCADPYLLIEQRYPLDTQPRTVTLSDGKTYKIDEQVSNWCVSVRHSGWAVLSAEKSPPCLCAEDFEKCAALLREIEK